VNDYRNVSAGTWEWWNASPSWPLSLANTNPVLMVNTATLAPSRQVIYERNNVLVSTNTNGSTTAMNWLNPQLGTSNNGGSIYTGTMGEVLIYSRALTASERTQLAQYLCGKWGIVLGS
jgi:hypothetical protein